jgi:hypothetical protein
MNTMNQEAPERQEIEALLPWHAAGTLSRNDAERVEQALSSDRELARRFDLVREELHETIHLNELLGHPSSRAAEKLFAAIEAEGARAPARRSFDLAGRFANFLSSLAPRTLAYSAGAAAIVMLVQGVAVTTALLKDQGGEGPSLASHASCLPSCAIVRFAPQATATEISRFLNAHKAEFVGGPSNGNFTLRLTQTPKSDTVKAVLQMQSDTKIVDFVAAKD